ncbi:DUF3892 domain-containing protein [Oenococcus sp. UCMA 17063]|nr:DUF3892 domain-containing protein [Oenococcus sp. UCMA 17063]
MKHEIVAIKLSKNNQRIIEVKIKQSKLKQTFGVPDIVEAFDVTNRIKKTDKYFYRDRQGRETEVEFVDRHNILKACIKTAGEPTKTDNLRDLPTF